MPRTTIKIRPAQIEANDPRLLVAVAAGTLRADQVWLEGGWRKAPAQCPICVELIKGAPFPEIMALLDAWNAAYRARCLQHETAALAALS